GLLAGGEWQRRRVTALAEIRIDEVDAGCRDAHQHLAGPGHRPGNFDELQNLGAAGPAYLNCLHVSILAAGASDLAETRLSQEALLGRPHAHHALHGIGRAVRLREEVTHLKLAEQADADELHARDDKHAGYDEHRCVLAGDVMAGEQLVDEQPERDASAREHADQAEAAEEVQRARHVLEQETNREEIEEHAKGATEAVVALAVFARGIRDRHLADGRAIPACQRGDEAMHLAVERNVLDDLTAIGFVGRAEVVNVYAGELRHRPVGDARRHAAEDEVVGSLGAPSAHHVVAFLQLGEEARNLAGVVLQVAVHGDDEFTGGVVEAGGERRGLAEVAAQLDHEDARIDRGNLLKQTVRAVARAVIDEDQFKAGLHMLHHLLHAIVKARDALLFVVEGDDDGILRHSLR